MNVTAVKFDDEIESKFDKLWAQGKELIKKLESVRHGKSIALVKCRNDIFLMKKTRDKYIQMEQEIKDALNTNQEQLFALGREREENE